jgi:hypothetical protein
MQPQPILKQIVGPPGNGMSMTVCKDLLQCRRGHMWYSGDTHTFPPCEKYNNYEGVDPLLNDYLTTKAGSYKSLYLKMMLENADCPLDFYNHFVSDPSTHCDSERDKSEALSAYNRRHDNRGVWQQAIDANALKLLDLLNVDFQLMHRWFIIYRVFFTPALVAPPLSASTEFL